MSPSAWGAAMRPNRYGSSTSARKKSTVCNRGGAPGKVTSAASSGLANPIATPTPPGPLAGAPSRGIGRRAIGLIDHDKAALIERHTGLGQPWRPGRLGDPQRLVEADDRAIGGDQSARFDPYDRVVRDDVNAAFDEDAREQPAHPRIVRRQQPFPRDQSHFGPGGQQTGGAILRRHCPFDPPG